MLLPYAYFDLYDKNYQVIMNSPKENLFLFTTVTTAKNGHTQFCDRQEHGVDYS